MNSKKLKKTASFHGSRLRYLITEDLPEYRLYNEDT